MVDDDGASAPPLSADQIEAKRRIAVLEEFAATLHEFETAYAADVTEAIDTMYDGHTARRASRSDAARKKLLRFLPEVKPHIDAAFGGPPYLEISGGHFEIFANLLASETLTAAGADKVQEAIGFYESVVRGTLTMPNSGARETLDIVQALNRGLRPAFSAGAPALERPVQDAVGSILSALGFKYSRDKESTAFAGKGFKPDFVVGSLSLAIEVKLAKEGHSASAIVEELSADLVPYAKAWARILIVIYDVGSIDAPHLIEDGFNDLGPHVTAIVIKH